MTSNVAPKIYKYVLIPPATSEACTELSLPKGHRILSVQAQGGDLVLRALVHPESPKVTRRFRVVCTGHHIEGELGEYLATVQLHGHPIPLVLHIFLEREV